MPRGGSSEQHAKAGREGAKAQPRQAKAEGGKKGGSK
jgi:general stress protein YciG